jgi:hypothetical protein
MSSGGSSLPFNLIFEPLIPVALLAFLAAAALAVILLGLWARASGTWWRALLFAAALVLLANPVLVEEERRAEDDVALLVVDESPSQGIRDRAEQATAAAAALEERIEALDGVDLEIVRAGGSSAGATPTARDEGGTRLFADLAEAVAQIDRRRLAGVLMVTDGQVHDAPAEGSPLPEGTPLHVFVTGERGEADRRVFADGVPSYAVVGEPQRFRVRVDDLGEVADAPPTASVAVRRDGEELYQVDVPVGREVELEFALDHAGETVLEVEAEPGPDELTEENNRAVFFVQGVRDRLRVLLVSGEPYPGLRVWRNLLKADPSVDLVHFVILRPPEKQDGTPIRELALIAFPSRELFEVKLQEFDLVIFDRYTRRGLLPFRYLENVATFVGEGGALLEVAGPDSAGPFSLYRTPLARLFPGRPSGTVFEQSYSPSLTDIGERHPVTEALEGSENGDGWGRWFRQIDIEDPDDGQVLMSGVAERPLLVLKREGEGRVAQLLSDQAWLWARGFEGGGPQSQLLRRLVHWLMKEPELEEEALRAEARGSRLRIERRSLSGGEHTVTVTSPSGEAREVTLREVEPGEARADIDAAETGLYRVADGDEHIALAVVGSLDPLEFSDPRASDEHLAAAVAASEGSLLWLSDGELPSVRKVSPRAEAEGRGWIGLRANEHYTVLGTTQRSLVPALLAVALLLGLLALAWRAEGR